MPQELLSTITREENERIDRARRYERLTIKRRDLLRAIARLEGTPREPIDAFEQILKLSAGIPEKFVTRGRRLGREGRGSDHVPLPGDLISRFIIEQIARDGIEDAQLRQADLDDTLARARRMLVATEEALKEFE
jgi:hypothetical protein